MVFEQCPMCGRGILKGYMQLHIASAHSGEVVKLVARSKGGMRRE